MGLSATGRRLSGDGRKSPINFSSAVPVPNESAISSGTSCQNFPVVLEGLAFDRARKVSCPNNPSGSGLGNPCERRIPPPQGPAKPFRQLGHGHKLTYLSLDQMAPLAGAKNGLVRKSDIESI